MKSTDSKEKRIRTCLIAGNPLSKLEAIEYFGHLNLGDVVLQLRRDGHNVKTTMKTNKKTGARYAEYQICKT